MLPPGEVEALAGHLEHCPRCADLIAGLDGDDALTAKLADTPPEYGGAVDALIGRLKRLATQQGSSPAGSGLVLAPPQGPDEIGRVGNYRVLGLMGAGGMGMVYRARDGRLPRLVALKTLLSGPQPSAERLTRFRREAEAVAQLQHPNVVQLYEVGEQDGHPYLAMEYVGGGNLADRLDDHVLAARPAAELIETLARAVQAAHERGIIHRDLKPANVLLREDGTPKVADFGLAKTLNDDSAPTRTGAVLGTPGYMAPEQVAGSGEEVGPAADVYGLGAILYECLTGRPPFRAATPLETLDLVRSQDPVPPRQLNPNVPADLETVCLKCLAKEPGKRYPSAAELADDLGRFLRGEPIRARRAGVTERVWKWARRKPMGAALVLVSGLFLVALIAGDQVYSARLRASVQQARESAADAQQQRSRADAGYRAARDALNRMLGHVQRRGLGEVPQLKELQRAQCEDALVFYQGVFAGSDDPDPEIRLDAARAYQRAANIQVLLGRGTDALQNLGRAIDLIESLPAQQRDRPDTQDLLASCYGDRGVIKSRPADRERDVGKALAIRRRLAREQPDDPGRQNHLATSEHQMGQVLINASRLADAEPHVARAAAIRQRLIQDYPREEGYQEVLAGDYVNLGLVYGNLRREAEAAAVHEKLESLLRPLIARRPDDVRNRLVLAGAQINWGLGLLGKGQAKAALAHCTEAVELAEAALRREPRLSMASAYALNAHGARAQTYQALERWAEAARDWDRVVELDTTPRRWIRRVARTEARARAGEHAGAIAEARELVGLPEVSANGVWELARVHVLAMLAARSDPRLSASERDALAERYAAGAIELLRRLHKQGYFKDPRHLRWLKTNPDWQPLREREDFRKLLEQIAPAGK
jgi:serine/threonine-protein kinase